MANNCVGEQGKASAIMLMHLVSPIGNKCPRENYELLSESGQRWFTKYGQTQRTLDLQNNSNINLLTTQATGWFSKVVVLNNRQPDRQLATVTEFESGKLNHKCHDNNGRIIAKRFPCVSGLKRFTPNLIGARYYRLVAPCETKAQGFFWANLLICSTERNPCPIVGL